MPGAEGHTGRRLALPEDACDGKLENMVNIGCLTPGAGAFAESAAVKWVRAMVNSASLRHGDKAVGSNSGDLDDVKRTRDGDPEAYRRLIEHHQDHVARILWRFSRDRGVHEELVQDVFVEAYLSLGGYSGQAPLDHWLARIATRVGYRHWKQKACQKESEPLDFRELDQLVGDEQAASSLEPDLVATRLHRLLAQMPPRDRLVLTLRYLEQCDVAETARRIGWTQTMVKVQTLRARHKLRKLVERSKTELSQ